MVILMDKMRNQVILIIECGVDDGIRTHSLKLINFIDYIKVSRNLILKFPSMPALYRYISRIVFLARITQNVLVK